MPSSPAAMCKDCSKRATGNGYCENHQTTNACTEYKRAFDKNRAHEIHRRLYQSARWRAVRAIILRRDPLCIKCGHKASQVVHHIIDAVEWLASGHSFFDQSNLQGLCKPCHDSHTARTAGFASPSEPSGETN